MRENPSKESSDTLALYTALALFFSIIELLIPKPIPFFRIGLANLPLLVALTFLSSKDFILLVMLKIVGQAIVGGTLFSYVFLFSASGSLASGLMMLILRGFYPRRISLVGIGVLGALASNTAQLGFAAWMIFGNSTRLVAPLLLVMGTASGILLGVSAQFVLEHSRWVRLSVVSRGKNSRSDGIMYTPGERREALARLFFGIMMVPPFILQSGPGIKAVHVVLILLYSRSLGLRVRLLPGLLILAAVTVAGVLTPLGEVLFTVGSFPVTSGALEQGLRRGLNLVGMVYISRCSVSRRLTLPGKAGRLLSRVLYYFEQLTALRLKRFSGRGLLKNIRARLVEIDELLLRWSMGTTDTEHPVVPETAEQRGPAEPGKKHNSGKPSFSSGALRGFLSLASGIILLQWLLFFLG